MEVCSEGEGGEGLVEILGSLRANKNRFLCRSCVVKDLYDNFRMHDRLTRRKSSNVYEKWPGTRDFFLRTYHALYVIYVCIVLYICTSSIGMYLQTKKNFRCVRSCNR